MTTTPPTTPEPAASEKVYERRCCPRCGNPQVGTEGVWWHDEPDRDTHYCDIGALKERLATAEAERDEALALWKNEVQFREDWKARAEEAEEALTDLAAVHPNAHQSTELIERLVASERSLRVLRPLLRARAAIEASKP